MPFSLRVLQGEMIIVQDPENQKYVFDLYTTGMNPCVGLILWSKDFCGLAHIDQDEKVQNLEPIIEHFSTKFKPPYAAGYRPIASIVMAHGVGGGKGWYSEQMSTSIRNLARRFHIDIEVTRPIMINDAVSAKISVPTGTRNYSFDVNQVSSYVQKIDAEPNIIAGTGSPDYLSVGFFERLGELCRVSFVKGTDTALLWSSL